MFEESSFLVTGIPEGRCIKTVKSGSKVDFILNYKGYHLDKEYNVVRTADWEPDDPRWQDVHIPSLLDEAIHSLLGLRIVGIPPRCVDIEKRTWTEWEVKDDKADQSGGRHVANRSLVVRSEETRYFFVSRFPYAFVMDNVETSLGIKLNIEFTVYVEGVNPWIALVDNNDWFMVFDGLVRAWVKDYFGRKNFLDLLSEESKIKGASTLKQKQNKEILELLEELGLKSDTPDSGSIPSRFDEHLMSITHTRKRDGAELPLPESLGVKIVDAEIEDLDLSVGDNPIQKFRTMLEERAQKKLEAKTHAEVTPIRAKADKDKKILEAEAEAAEIRLAGEARATAMNAETIALEQRRKVEEEYLRTPEGAQLAAARVHADGFVRMAEALKGIPNLSSVVFPQQTPMTMTVPVQSGKKPDKQQDHGNN